MKRVKPDASYHPLEFNFEKVQTSLGQNKVELSWYSLKL